MEQYEFEFLFFATVVFFSILIVGHAVAHYIIAKHSTQIETLERDVHDLQGRNEPR